MIMPKPTRVSGEAFALERLAEARDLDYATLRAEAAAAGISLQPIHYGRARKQLGLPALRDSRPAASPRAAATEPEPAPAGPTAPQVAEAPPRKGSAAFEFLVQQLRTEPGLAYGELRDRAAARDFKIAPIMYGRAKAVLGLVPVKPRGSKKAAATAAVAPLRLKQVESVAADRFARQLDEVRSLEQLVQVVKELDAERRRLRALLERLATMIAQALGS